VLHLGTDGGGSIRIPAGFTGICGLKPTFGRVPAYPASPFGTVAHLGPMARSTDDLALMLDVLSQRDLRDWYQNPLPPVPKSDILTQREATERKSPIFPDVCLTASRRVDSCHGI